MTFLTSLLFLADGAASGGGDQQGGGFMGMPFMLLMMFALMYFMIIRPQRRQRQEHEQRMAGLRSGDKVITSGGIHGMITNVKNTSVVLRIAENVRVEVEKSCVATIVSKADEPDEPETKEAAADASEESDAAPQIAQKN